MKGQYSLEDCPQCSKTLKDIHDSKDIEEVRNLVASLRRWTDGMSKNKTQRKGTSFWKSQSERESLSRLFQLYLVKKHCKQVLGDVPVVSPRAFA